MENREFLKGPWNFSEAFNKTVHPKMLEFIKLCQDNNMPVFISVAYKGDDDEVMTHTSSLKGPHHAHIYCLLDQAISGFADFVIEEHTPEVSPPHPRRN